MVFRIIFVFVRHLALAGHMLDAAVEVLHSLATRISLTLTH